jgi:hypothetical protein
MVGGNSFQSIGEECSTNTLYARLTEYNYLLTYTWQTGACLVSQS